MKVNQSNCEKYGWGNQCHGWHLVNSPQLSVIREIMPPGSSEVKHKHSNCQQFFFILRGKATFITNENIYQVLTMEGFHVLQNTPHQIKNEQDEDLEFLVISQPHAHDDRILVD